MGTATIVVPRTYRAYKWSTGQVRSFAQPPGLWLDTGHFLPPLAPMRQVFPRPDAEVSSYAHHKWAYFDSASGTGIQYRKRITPTFGSPPYNFVLVDGPSGMEVQVASWDTDWLSGDMAASTGYALLTWTPTSAVSGQRVWVRAYDQNGEWIDFIWTVSTSSGTSQFIFVDNVNGSDSNTGTLASPYKTLAGAYGTSGSTTNNAGAICYLRGSATQYEMPNFGSSYFTIDPTLKPSALLGYPGESVTLDASSALIDLVGADMAVQDISCDNYNDTIANYRLISVSAERWYVDSVLWNNAGYGSSGTSVASMVMSGDTSGANIQYGAMCGCTELNRRSGNPGNNDAGCALYSYTDVAVWLNRAYAPGSAVDNVWYLKSNISYGFMWGNYANINAIYGFGIGQAPPEPPGICGPNDFLFNIGIGVGQINFPNTGNSSYQFGASRLGRNSVFGIPVCNQSSGPGTFRIDSNALQTPSSLPTGSAITTDGKNVVAASGVLNFDGSLNTTNYPNDLGTVGAQIK